jgi:signal transduction histidine kinase
MFASTRIYINETKVFSSAQTSSNSIVYTQREALAFTVKFSQWLGGELPKREVQIAQAMLAQRLSVIDADGTVTGKRISPQIRERLIAADATLTKSPEGILPPDLQEVFSDEVTSLINQLVFDSRQMLATYQKELDANVLASTKTRDENTLNNLWALISFILLTSILVIWGIITFRTQYKLAKKTLKDEVEALIISQAMLKKAESTVKTLEELNNTKNDFISTVNHELRTPLTSIIGYIDVLKTLDIEKDLDQLPQITTVIDRNSEVLLDIIESILSLSTLDSTNQVARFDKTNLAEIVERKIFVLTPLIHAKSLTVNFNHDISDDYSILGNAGQVSQVVLNLLSNAIKFSPDEASIDISLSMITKGALAGGVEMVIKDQGIGIPADEIPKLFTRFFRASNAVSSQITGTGLGLAIVVRILDLHKATVRVESVVDMGSSFIVDFPKYVSETEQHVSKKRPSVLFKAIVAIKESEHSELIAVCHQMSGTLGFYALEPEMILVSAFQSWLEANPEALTDLVELKRGELVLALEKTYSNLDKGLERQS